MKYLLTFLLISVTSSVVAESSISNRFVQTEGTLTSFGVGAVSQTVDGEGFIINARLEPGDTNFIVMGSYEGLKGLDIQGSDWSADKKMLGAGYRVFERASELGKFSIVTGLSYFSHKATFRSGGMTFIMDRETRVFVGGFNGYLGQGLEITGELLLDLEGDSDPNFSIGLGFELVEDGSIFVGYEDSNLTYGFPEDTSDMTSLTMGYKIRF